MYLRMAEMLYFYCVIKMKRVLKYLITALVLLAVTACKKFEEYPDEPFVEFISLTKIPNSLGYDDKGILKIGFTDGDGDIGLSQSDTIPPFNQGGEYYYNFFIYYFEKQHGEYVKFDLDPPVHARIPPIVSDFSSRGVKGTIEIELEINNFFSPFDTICFEFYIVDRALNKSNIVRTPPIKINK